MSPPIAIVYLRDVNLSQNRESPLGVSSGRSDRFYANGRFGEESGHPTWANVRSHRYRTFRRSQKARFERQLTARSGRLIHGFESSLRMLDREEHITIQTKEILSL